MQRQLADTQGRRGALMAEITKQPATSWRDAPTAGVAYEQRAIRRRHDPARGWKAA
jgi:hypothetical protein